MFTLVMLLSFNGHPTIVVPNFPTGPDCELAALNIIHKFNLTWIDPKENNGVRYICVKTGEGK